MSAVIAGLGCRRDCSADDVASVVRRASEAAGRAVTALALPAFKADEAGPRAAAAMLGVSLLLVETEALAAAQPRCVTISDAALAATGIGSVAEGCALAACGAGARLILSRVSHGGATCALAEPA